MDRRTILLAGAAASAAGAWKLVAGRGLGGAPHAGTPASREIAHATSGVDTTTPTTGNAAPASAADPVLGINLTPINYWLPVAFIDRLKASIPWATGATPAPMSDLGYPAGMNGPHPVTTMIPCEEGRYVLTHDGDMDVRVQGATLVARSADGARIYEVRGKIGTNASRQLIIDAIRKPPTFMHFIRQKDAAAFAAGEIFAPEFLAQLKGFDTLRFMDWIRVNSSTVTNAFPPERSCSYVSGVPMEVMLALAKKVDAHPWLCVPHLASDAFIDEIIGTLRKAAVNGRAPYLEYSNEVWNLGFEQARYAQQEAVTRWGTGTPGGVFYGYRAGQIAQRARGAGIRMVLGAQTATPARADAVWDGVRRSGATDRDFAGWIIATYITGTLTRKLGPTPALAAQGDIAGAIDNLLHASETGAMSVDTMRAVYTRHGEIARAHGLKLMAYEGNLHLNPIPAFADKQQLVKPFFEAITRSPDSAVVMQQNLAAFAAAGGSLACLYNLSSGPGNGGFFGVVDSGSWNFIRQRLARQTPTG